MSHPVPVINIWHLKDMNDVEWAGGFLMEVSLKIKLHKLTHDDQELGVEGREGRLERVAGVEIVESRHAIFSKSGQFVPAGSPGV